MLEKAQIQGFTLAELSAKLGLSLAPHADKDKLIVGVNTLEDAGQDELSFLANPKYTAQLDTTRAGAVIVDASQADKHQNALIAENPYLSFARVLVLFSKPQGEFNGQSELAYIHPEARLAPGVTVYPFVFIGPRVQIGEGSVIFPGAYLGEDSTLGKNCVVYPNAVLMSGTELGNACIVQPGAVLGSDGFGFVPGEAGIDKIPQIGRVKLGSDVEVGSNTAIDRAALGETRVGDGTKLDNLVQIGHNVRIGKYCMLAGQAGVSGSTRLGDRVILAGQAGLSGHLTVGDGAIIGPQSGLTRNVKEGEVMGGTPSMPKGDFLRSSVLLPRLPELNNRIRKLEKAVEALTSGLSTGLAAGQKAAKTILED